MDTTLETDISLLKPRLVTAQNVNDWQNIRYLPRDKMADNIWRNPRGTNELIDIVGGPAKVAADLAFDVGKLHKAFPPRWSDDGGSGRAGTAPLEAFAQVSVDVKPGLVIRAVRLVPARVPNILCKKTPSGAASGRVEIWSGGVARDSSASSSMLVEYYVAFTEKELFQLDERKTVTPGDAMVMKHPSLFSLRDCLRFEAEHGADANPPGWLPGDQNEKLECLLKDDALYYVNEIKRRSEVFPSATDPLDRSTPWIVSGVPLLFDVGDRFTPQIYAGESNKTASDLLSTIRPAQDSSNGPPGTRSNFLAIAVAAPPATSADLHSLTALEEFLSTNFCTFFTAFHGACFAARRALVYNSALNQGGGGGSRTPPAFAPAGFEVVVHTSDTVATASSSTATRVAFACLHIAAARAAGVQKLVYHLSEQPQTDAPTPGGGRAGAHVEMAKQLLDECWTEDCVSTDELLRHLQNRLADLM
ncbi:hypothetical protein HK405_011661 [Cladochytrium tenue]|nr:hypothetical protein HK405_011661 [Cladochytrium tenue]